MLNSLSKQLIVAILVVSFCLIGGLTYAQSNSASISGTVLDPSGAVVSNAEVEIHNPVSHFDRSTTSDKSGKFSFPNVPFNPYHLSVSGAGFAPYAQDVDVRSAVPLDVKIGLKVAGSSDSVTVEAGGDLLENDPTAHTDVDRALFDKIPLESSSSSLSSLVTLAARESPQTRTACFTEWAITRKLRSPLTVSRSPTSRAKYFRTRFRWIRLSRWRSSRAHRPPNMGERQAW